MENSLYPLKFKAIIKDKIWGGTRLKDILNKETHNIDKAGESWELSAIQGSLSVVKEGFLADNDIEELIEVYMGDLVGDKVYEKFGVEFPLLIKFIDANDWLSIQVHPDDEKALRLHDSYGKTEMWYVMEANNNAELIVGFNKELDKSKYLEALNSGSLRNILNYEKVKAGDVFFMPAGRIHATGPGILFAEIQQTSDITYRIYDWDRVDDSGNARELHTELALDAIDFKKYDKYKEEYISKLNEKTNIVECKFFKTNLLEIDKEIECDYYSLDSFVIYIALEGETEIYYNDSKEPVIMTKGETVLLPAMIDSCMLKPISGLSKIMEVYIPD